MTDLLSQCTKNAQKANFHSSKLKSFLPQDDQSDSDEASASVNTSVIPSTTHIWSVYSDKPPTMTAVSKEKPSTSMMNISGSNSAVKIEDIGPKKVYNYYWSM